MVRLWPAADASSGVLPDGDRMISAATQNQRLLTSPAVGATLVVVLNTDISYRNHEPSTVFGDSITKIISPDHVFNLPAEPAAR
ncbi:MULTISPECIES: hypothetical protein [Streptomyces]|uniref:Uncharacterized protein n=2 Tax=Streptomyces TaxID=1883 RepID=A0ABV9J033_9ACTN